MSGAPQPLQPDTYSLDLVSRVPELWEIAEPEIHSPFNLDSSQMDPARWQEIARGIEQRYDEFAGFVIIHGTDTMAFTAAALSFMLEGLEKPVVLTGAQLPLILPRSDARANLVGAVTVACQPVPEVGVFFHSKLYRGTRVRKQDIWSYEAFTSPNLAPLAELGLDIRLSRQVLPKRGPFCVDDRVDSRVLVFRIFPGIDPALLLAALDQQLHGVVLEAFGSGNLPVTNPGMLAFLAEATQRKIPVVIVSQSPRGAVDLTLYEVGSKARMAGVIPGGDMTVECATVKLMTVLGRTRDLAMVRHLMLTALAGERST